MLNNFDINPVESVTEILVTFRSKNSFLITLASDSLQPVVKMSYDSIDEVRYGRFSQCGRFIYTLTKIGTLNIFDKLTAKLISKLNPQRNPDAVTDDQSLDVEVDGILGVSDP